jgi:signal peptide peptidase SppA
MIHRILSKVVSEPWAVEQKTYDAICKIISSKLAGQSFDGSLATEQQTIPQAPSIAVIPVWGVLGKHLSNLEMQCGGASFDATAEAIKSARDNPEVQAIVLWWNSPGGTTQGCEELAALIAATDTVKPIYSFTDSLMASAAYWCGSQARAVITTPSALVGNIGVIVAYRDESEALKKEGVSYVVFSAGEYKDMGNPSRPINDAEKALIQNRVDALYQRFVSAVTSKRNIDIKAIGARALDGQEAINANLSDGNVQDIEEMLALVASELTPSA